MTDAQSLSTIDRLDTPKRIVAAGVTAFLVVGAVLGAVLASALATGLVPLAAVVLSGAGYLAASAVALAGLRRGGPEMLAFGGCNRVTTLRLGIASVLGGAIAAPFLVAPAGVLVWPAFGLAVVALILDGVDGWMARRSGFSSAFGARFDMEVDAATIMILSVLAWQTGQAPVWVLALGLVRYGFVLAGMRWAFLRADLPPSFRRKVVCVVQVAVLAALIAPVIIPPVSSVLAAGALAALIWSFAVDVLWQWRHRAS
jgi:phosphatidylglycerophosphate synthase